MEDLTVLGNAAAVPIVIFLTQFLKQTFDLGDFERHKANVLALLVSFVVCTIWEFYIMEPDTFASLGNLGFLGHFKFGIDLLIKGFATWLAASKIYDLGRGNKKRDAEVKEERRVLKEEIKRLQNGGGNVVDPAENEISSRLREILEKE